MGFDFDQARQYLKRGELKKLFIETLGWDLTGTDIDLPFEGDVLHLTAIAQKRGFGVYICSPLERGMPDYATRKRIESALRKLVHEHLVIFTNLKQDEQIWQWVRREAGRPITSREYKYYFGQAGEALMQRLQSLAFTLEEEEAIGVTDVLSKVRAAFDVDRVTKKFYDRFKDEHTAFLKFIKGIPDEGDMRWYASVTINRLMFVYFIQAKNFLDGNAQYLQRHLAESQKKGKDKFYREFLCPLFL